MSLIFNTLLLIHKLIILVCIQSIFTDDSSDLSDNDDNDLDCKEVGNYLFIVINSLFPDPSLSIISFLSSLISFTLQFMTLSSSLATATQVAAATAVSSSSTAVIVAVVCCCCFSRTVSYRIFKKFSWWKYKIQPYEQADETSLSVCLLKLSQKKNNAPCSYPWSNQPE